MKRGMFLSPDLTREQKEEQEKSYGFEDLESNAKMFIVGLLANKAVDAEKLDIASVAKRGFDLAEAFEAEAKSRAEKRGVR
jgi:hypothetical protein